jgi:tryptophan 2,3-dioxygenase
MMDIVLILVGVAGAAIIGFMLGVVQSLAKWLVEGEIRGAFRDRLEARVRSAAAELPPEIAAEQEAEWLAELAAALDRPRLAVHFVRMLPHAAREISAADREQDRQASASPRGGDAEARTRLVALSSEELLAEAWSHVRIFDGLDESVVTVGWRQYVDRMLLHIQNGLRAIDGRGDHEAELRSQLIEFCERCPRLG